MWIPTVEEAGDWAGALEAIPAYGRVDVGNEADLAIRFCLLAYGRNDDVLAQSRVLRSRESGESAVIELQFHGSDDFWKGAHLVVYLYRLPAAQGVGVVMAFKGSTANLEDWIHNFRFVRRCSGGEICGLASFGTDLFPETACGPLAGVRCHVGFLAYMRTLDARMMQFSTASLQPVLREWGVETGAPHFLAWLRSGAWKWCAIVGHSLGGAMASIAATELAVTSGKKPLLATLGAPVAGNRPFVRLQNECVAPGGGLCISNRGDLVPKLGYLGLNILRSSHGGRRVKVRGKIRHMLSFFHAHQRYTVPSDCFDSLIEYEESRPLKGPMPRRRTTFTFPGAAYRPSATADSFRFSLGTYFDVDKGQGR